MDLYNSILASIKLHTVDNPIQSFELEKQFSVPGNTIREVVRSARRSRIPIGNITPSGNNGYFLAKTLEEYLPTLTDIESRFLSLEKTYKEMKNTFIKDDCQNLLFYPK